MGITLGRTEGSLAGKLDQYKEAVESVEPACRTSALTPQMEKLSSGGILGKRGSVQCVAAGALDDFTVSSICNWK